MIWWLIAFALCFIVDGNIHQYQQHLFQHPKKRWYNGRATTTVTAASSSLKQAYAVSIVTSFRLLPSILYHILLHRRLVSCSASLRSSFTFYISFRLMSFFPTTTKKHFMLTFIHFWCTLTHVQVIHDSSIDVSSSSCSLLKIWLFEWKPTFGKYCQEWDLYTQHNTIEIHFILSRMNESRRCKSNRINIIMSCRATY